MKIPPVGESISSGVVSVWHKKSGEYVNAGEALLTLETDKVSTEITAEKAGLLETKVDEGQEVKIGEVVAVIDDQASPPAKAKAAAPNESKSAATSAGPRSPNAEVLSPAVRRFTRVLCPWNQVPVPTTCWRARCAVLRRVWWRLILWDGSLFSIRWPSG